MSALRFSAIGLITAGCACAVVAFSSSTACITAPPPDLPKIELAEPEPEVLPDETEAEPIKGPLERGLGLPDEPDLLTGGGLQEQGMNGCPGRDQRVDGALGDGREHVDRLLRTALGQEDGGGGTQ